MRCRSGASYEAREADGWTSDRAAQLHASMCQSPKSAVTPRSSAAAAGTGCWRPYLTLIVSTSCKEGGAASAGAEVSGLSYDKLGGKSAVRTLKAWLRRRDNWQGAVHLVAACWPGRAEIGLHPLVQPTRPRGGRTGRWVRPTCTARRDLPTGVVSLRAEASTAYGVDAGRW